MGRRRLRRVGGRAVRAGGLQQPVAQGGGVGVGEVGQRRLGVAPAHDLEPQLGQAQHPADERPHDVDALHPGQRHAAGPADEDAAVDLQLAVGQPVAGGPPGDRSEHHGEQGAADEHRRHCARALPQPLRAEDGQQDDERPAAAQQRGQRVQAAPAVVGPGRCGGPVGRHRPAARASPSADSRSRSRAASAARRPGTLASVAAAAVCRVTVASP